MSDKTRIAWTDSSWNPIRGCTAVSAGCENCYAQRVAHRFSGPGQPYEGLTRATAHGPKWTGEVRLVPEMLEQPLKWRKPRRIFVNSMSDLFHEWVTDDFIDDVFDVMRRAERHTFQVLTKRPERMRDYMLNSPNPPPNVWLGVSVENEAAAEKRIHHLVNTPAAVRFLSVEPLLGPVRLDAVQDDELGALWNVLDGMGIGWVIVGGESGPNARPCDIDWIRSIVAQCKSAGVPVFVKQLGAKPYLGSEPSGDSGELPITSRCRFEVDEDHKSIRTRLLIRNRAGADPSEWPADLRVQVFP